MQERETIKALLKKRIVAESARILRQNGADEADVRSKLQQAFHLDEETMEEIWPDDKA